jgi:hypothetical protein
MERLMRRRNPDKGLKLIGDAAVEDSGAKYLLTPGTGKGLTCGPSLVMKYHLARRISSEDSVKMLAVGNTPSFGRRTVCAFKRKFSGMHGDVARI